MKNCKDNGKNPKSSLLYWKVAAIIFLSAVTDIGRVQRIRWFVVLGNAARVFPCSLFIYTHLLGHHALRYSCTAFSTTRPQIHSQGAEHHCCIRTKDVHRSYTCIIHFTGMNLILRIFKFLTCKLVLPISYTKGTMNNFSPAANTLCVFHFPLSFPSAVTISFL